MDQAVIIKAFGAFFAIMNPFINLPIFLAMTSGMSVPDQRRLAIKVALFAFFMCAVLLVLGQRIIDFFGITVDEFRGRRWHRAGQHLLVDAAWFTGGIDTMGQAVNRNRCRSSAEWHFIR